MRPPVNFTSQDYLRDPPRPRAVAGRRAGRRDRVPFIGKVWITTTQELAGRVLKDSETFTLRKNGGAFAGLRWWMPALSARRQQHADHGRAGPHAPTRDRRRSLPPPRGPRHGAAHSRHRQRARQRDVRGGDPGRSRGPLCARVPLSVICELLGLPRADRPKFMAWTGSITASPASSASWA